MDVSRKEFAFSQKNTDSIKVKAAEFITEKFSKLIQNTGHATMVNNEGNLERNFPKNPKKYMSQRWEKETWKRAKRKKKKKS